jgi:FixJ family two-component response regulator
VRAKGSSTQSTVAAPYASPVVYVVDDELCVRPALESLIRGAGWQPRLFTSAEEFLACGKILAPSCLILDVRLAYLSGLDSQHLIADRAEIQTIFITGDGDVQMAVNAMKAGAIDFFTKPFCEEAMLNAIRVALEFSRVAVTREAAVRPIRERYALLTPREREVMSLLVAGLVNRRIGTVLGIGERTVKSHRSVIMRKMNARSFAHLIRLSETMWGAGSRASGRPSCANTCHYAVIGNAPLCVRP